MAQVERDNDNAVRIAALVVLGAVLVAAIAGLTVVACLTDRDLTRPEFMTFVLALATATLGGFTLTSLRRRHHWRIEHDANGGDR